MIIFALMERGGDLTVKITKNNAPLAVGAVVVLPSEEILIIKAIYREPDGICYRVQFVELDGDEYVPVGEPRIMWHYELIGAEV